MTVWLTVTEVIEACLSRMADQVHCTCLDHKNCLSCSFYGPIYSHTSLHWWCFFSWINNAVWGSLWDCNEVNVCRRWVICNESHWDHMLDRSSWWTVSHKCSSWINITYLYHFCPVPRVQSQQWKWPAEDNITCFKCYVYIKSITSHQTYNFEVPRLNG